MAKPNDTRITHVPANANPGSTPMPATKNLTLILEALLARQAANNAAPKPPKFARPPRIKPRRRITVSPSPDPTSDPTLPWIRLCGHWLEHAGFPLNQRVNVHVGKGFMILIPVEES